MGLRRAAEARLAPLPTWEAEPVSALRYTLPARRPNRRFHPTTCILRAERRSARSRDPATLKHSSRRPAMRASTSLAASAQATAPPLPVLTGRTGRLRWWRPPASIARKVTPRWGRRNAPLRTQAELAAFGKITLARR